MLLFLLSSLFVLSNGVSLELQPLFDEQVNEKPMVPLVLKDFNTDSFLKNGTLDSKSLIAELAGADPAKIQEVIVLIEAMIGVAQNDLATLTTTSTDANAAYDAAVSTYDAAVVAQSQGVTALATAVTDALAAKNVAEGAKSGAQSNLDAEKNRLDAEVASLRQVIVILQGLVGGAHPEVGEKVTPTTVTVLAPTGGAGQVITGWHKAPELINFGNEGLVGGWFLEMTLEFDYGSDITVWGFNCDYVLNPYTVEISSNGIDWTSVGGDSMTGDYAFTSSITLRYAKVQWLKTDGSNGFHWAVYQ